MLEMLQNTWKKMQAYRIELALSGLGVLGLATFAVVYPPALLPIVYTFASAVIGTALFAAGKFVASFFTKSDKKAADAPKAAEETKAADATAENAAEPSSTAKATAALNEAAVKEEVKAEVKAEVAEVAEEVAEQVASNDADADEEEEEETAMASFKM